MTERPAMANHLGHALLVLAACGASLANGLPSSPLFDPMLYLLRPFVAPFMAAPDVIFHMTSAFLAAVTLSGAGIPAAIYERARGQATSTTISLLIWLAFAALLAIPGLLGAIGYFDFE